MSCRVRSVCAIGNSESQYVWRKYDKREFRANVNTIPTGFTLSLYNPHYGDYVGDFSSVDEDYLIGTVINLLVDGSDVSLTLLSNNEVYCSYAVDSWSYSKTDKTITFISSDICGYSIAPTLDMANFNHFLSYVTAKDISKYPNSGLLGEYWYELLQQTYTFDIVYDHDSEDTDIIYYENGAKRKLILSTVNKRITCDGWIILNRGDSNNITSYIHFIFVDGTQISCSAGVDRDYCCYLSPKGIQCINIDKVCKSVGKKLSLVHIEYLD